MRKSFWVMMAVMFWLVSVCVLKAENIPKYKTQKEMVTEKINVFCLSEFYYVEAPFEERVSSRREDFIELSKKEKQRLTKIYGNLEFNYFLQLVSDPLFIVKSYKIVNVSTKDKDHATAIVKYDRLARAKGNNKDWVREIIPERVQDEAVRYNLINTKAGWKVLDPPLPRVSIEYVFLEYLRDKRADEEWNKKYPDRIEKQSKEERHVREERERQFKIIEKLFHENASKEDYQRVRLRVEEWISSKFHRAK